MIDAAVLTPRASEAPLQAQEAADGASAPGPGIRLVDLSDYPTHTTVDRFEVQLTNLTATAAYQVIVSSDSAGLGIGAFGTASQTQKVTGVAAKTLELFVYACAEGGGTVTAELRSAGSTTSLATVSQRLVVEAVPELAPGSGSTTTATAKSGSATVRSAARVGTPGLVPSISFPTKTTSSIKVTWGTPSDGGRALTGFGLLWWTGNNQPGYGTALVKGAAAREHTYSELQANTTYKFRIHACNGPDSCGWWTDPPKTVSTPEEPPDPPVQPPTTGRPGKPDITRVTTVSSDSTALTVHWATPSGTLTKFQLQRRRSGQSWPHLSQVAEPGRNDTRYTYTGLERGITYVFRIRACNGGTCSHWNDNDDDGRLQLPGTEPPLQPPGPVTSVSFSNLTTMSFTVAWEAPATDGGTAITGYGIQRKLGDAAWPPTDQVVVVGRVPREVTFQGLQRGTHSVRIQACNGKNRCADWPTVGHDVTIPPRPVVIPIVITPPGQVRDLTVDVETRQLAVDWRAPANSGGRDITRYEVAYKQQSLSTWIARDDVRSATSTTIPVSDTTTSYDVRVRACNGPISRDDCGTWRQTNSVHGPPPPPVGVPTAGCEAARREDEPAIPPVGPIVLNLRPQYIPDPQRPGIFTALLTWTLVANAPSYEVQIRKLEPTRWGAWGPRDRRSAFASSLTTVETCMVINLSAIVTTSSGADEGLAHSKAWGFQVRAVNSAGGSEYSSDLVLIDNPIVAPNGYSPSDTGQISFQWASISDIMQPKGSDYSSGNVGFNYRKVVHDTDESIPHTQLGWLPYSHLRFGSSPDANGGTVSGKARRGLSLDTIYAIQFRLDATGPDGTSKVYAARDAYAWTSGSRPRLGDRVATFPMDPDVSKTYVYRICPDGFGDYLTDWKLTIEHAFRQWEIATGDLVRATRTADGCPDFTKVLEKAVEAVSMYGPVTDGNRARIEGHIRTLDSYTKLDLQDRVANEIHMVDFDAQPVNNLRTQLVFSGLSVNLGINECSMYGACATRERHHESGLRTVDITINKGVYDRDPLLVDIDLEAPLSVIENIYDDIRSTEIVFNTCPQTVFDPRSYAVIVHEAGHVFGLNGFTLSESDRDVWHDLLKGHPAIRGSVLTYKNRNLRLDDAPEYNFSSEEGACAPHPFDVMALYALYQAP